jgi:hypothetical protein
MWECVCDAVNADDRGWCYSCRGPKPAVAWCCGVCVKANNNEHVRCVYCKAWKPGTPAAEAGLPVMQDTPHDSIFRAGGYETPKTESRAPVAGISTGEMLAGWLRALADRPAVLDGVARETNLGRSAETKPQATDLEVDLTNRIVRLKASLRAAATLFARRGDYCGRQICEQAIEDN